MDHGYFWRLKNLRAAAFLIAFSLLFAYLSFRGEKSPIIFSVEKGAAWWAAKSTVFEVNALPATSCDLGHIPNFSEPQ